MGDTRRRPCIPCSDTSTRRYWRGLAGPHWHGTTPAGIKQVFRSETEIVGTLTRTAWTGEADRDDLIAMQRHYRIRPLSEYLGGKPPAPAPRYLFPAWDEVRAKSIDFISYLNFTLRFAPTVASEQEMRQRFAGIGIDAGRPFDASGLDPALRTTIEAGIADAQQSLQAAIARTTNSIDLFGTREFLGQDYIMRRAVGAAVGIYGNSKEEAQYGGFAVDADNKPLDGARKYVMHFAKDQVPPVRYFWSMTMYDLPNRLLVSNPTNRYAIGSRTKGLKTNRDGSVDIYLQNSSPGNGKESNWLPTPPSGNFFMVLRMYGPEGSLADGTWRQPVPTAVL